MALSNARGDPLALSNGGHHPPTDSGKAPSNNSTQVSNGHDPLTATCSNDCHTADGDEDVTVKDVVSKVEQKQQRSLVVQTANRPSQNGLVVKQNGSLRNLHPSSTEFSSPAVTDPQRLAKRHHSSTPSPSSSFPPFLPPPISCQHCHFNSTLCCPCGQQECSLFKNPGPSPGSAPHPGTTSSCPCCLSACTYSHSHAHPPQSSSPLCLHHHHHQCWQEQLQSHTHATGIRYGEEKGFEMLIFFFLIDQISVYL